MHHANRILAAAGILLLLAARLPAEAVTATGMIEAVDTGARTVTVRRKTANGEKTASLKADRASRDPIAGALAELGARRYSISQSA